LRPTVTYTPATSTDSLLIRPLHDEVVDTLGFDPRSSYVETYWLGILGPSTTWLLRRLVAGLERSPTGYELPLAETARCLGLGDRGGRHSPFMRALTRLVQFEIAEPRGRQLSVRRKVPPLNKRQIAALPASLQAEHLAMQQAALDHPPFEQLRRRSQQLALSLLELGEDLEATERQLLRWKFHPALARESAAWAWERHKQAKAAAVAAGGVPTSGGVPGASGGAAVASVAVAGDAAEVLEVGGGAG
jgi:hypothetical protein